MACPFFDPIERLADGAWFGAVRVSLGDLYAGVCQADSHTPDRPALIHLCNLGYARSKCPHFPPSGEADAVNFSVAKDDGRLVQIRFAMEREHLPVACGALEYERETRRPVEAASGELILRQAGAYLDSYLRRK